MSNSQQNGEEEQATSSGGIGWSGKVEDRFQKIKEHAEAYPYVWASYILVYGGLGIWASLRWRKLRKTEDRVRALQQRLHQLVEAESKKLPSTSSSSSIAKPPTSASFVESSSPPAEKTPK